MLTKIYISAPTNTVTGKALLEMFNKVNTDQEELLAAAPLSEVISRKEPVVTFRMRGTDQEIKDWLELLHLLNEGTDGFVSQIYSEIKKAKDNKNKFVDIRTDKLVNAELVNGNWVHHDSWFKRHDEQL